MPTRPKKPKLQEPAEPEHFTLPSDVLRELVTPDTFRVWHDSHNCQVIGEYVVTIAQDGVRVWESYQWHPSKLNATDDHDAGDGDAHPGYLLTWPEVLQIAGRGNELVQGILDEIEEIERDLAYWHGERNREAGRIARAREAQRSERMRWLLSKALEVRDAWMPSGRKRVTWRDMVRRRRE